MIADYIKVVMVMMGIATATLLGVEWIIDRVEERIKRRVFCEIDSMDDFKDRVLCELNAVLKAKQERLERNRRLNALREQRG